MEQRRSNIGGAMKRGFVLIAITPLLAIANFSEAAGPSCPSWPTNMSYTVLKNAGLTDESKLDLSRTKAVRLASEKIGKDRYRQIYDITFREKSGGEIRVVTSSVASSDECSISSVDIYVVARKFNSDAPIR